MKQFKIDLSLITCLYNGDRYIDNLCQMFEANLGRLSGTCSAEYIIINDSPWNKVSIPEKYKHLPIHIYDNEKNLGIHRSRINGIEKARGKYILILDQDDEIRDEYLLSQTKKIKDRDVVVCNGYKEYADSSKAIYRDRIKMSLINSKNIYVMAANQIVSPGQCLIKKESIPSAWIKYEMKTNGSDDLFLWLLYLYSGRRFAINSEKLYCHKQVGNNLSNDLKKMCESDHEMCYLAEKEKLLPEKAIKKRMRMTHFIAETNYTQKLSLKVLLKYPDIVFVKALAVLL